MSFFALDQSANLEDGLYTGEEICAMLGENADTSVGLAQIGVEMELDPESLSDTLSEILGSTAISLEEDPTLDEDEFGVFKSLPSLEGEHSVATMKVDHRTAPAAGMARTRSAPLTTGGINRAVTKSKRGVIGGRGRLYTIKRQIMTRASVKLKSVAKLTSGLPLSPKAQRALVINASHDALDDLTKVKSHHHQYDNFAPIPNDNSTCAMTHASDNSNSTIPSQCTHSSSITQSTCDFHPDHATNHGAVFETYLATNPWEAARRGDYATLRFIADHDDDAIWTQADRYGNVPLYYACVSYCQSTPHYDPLASSFGKYGLESVKLCVEQWPEEMELPEALLDLMHNTPRTLNDGGVEEVCMCLHEDVLEVLLENSKRKGGEERISQQQELVLPTTDTIDNSMAIIQAASSMKEEQDNIVGKKAVEIEGVQQVTPQSFFDDLGDEGYVEDY